MFFKEITRPILYFSKKTTRTISYFSKKSPELFHIFQRNHKNYFIFFKEITRTISYFSEKTTRTISFSKEITRTISYFSKKSQGQIHNTKKTTTLSYSTQQTKKQICDIVFHNAQEHIAFTNQKSAQTIDCSHEHWCSLSKVVVQGNAHKKESEPHKKVNMTLLHDMCITAW